MYKFGLKKSPPDERDYCLQIKYEKIDLPLSFNLKDEIEFILNQHDMNACASHAIANQLILSSKDDNIDYLPSRLFIYFNARFIENNYKTEGIEDMDF